MNRRIIDFVVVVLAVLLGAGIGSRIAEQRLVRVARAQGLNSVAADLQTALDRAQTCEADQAAENSRLTVLYDVSGSTQSSIQLFHGLVDVSSPALPAQARPRWLIPAKLIPLVVGSKAAVAYAYFNPQSKTIEGPFVPQQNQATEGAQQ